MTRLKGDKEEPGQTAAHLGGGAEVAGWLAEGRGRQQGPLTTRWRWGPIEALELGAPPLSKVNRDAKVCSQLAPLLRGSGPADRPVPGKGGSGSLNLPILDVKLSLPR